MPSKKLSQSFSSRSADQAASDKRSSHVHPPRPPLGYVLHKSFLRDVHKNETLIELLLPAQVKADLDKQAHDEGVQKALAESERQRLAQEKMDRLREADKAIEAQAIERRLLAQTPPGQSVIDMNTGKTLTAPAIELRVPLAEPDYDPKRSYPVYPVNAPNNLLSRSTLNTPDKDVRKRDDELYKKMAAQGNLREIAMPENVVAALDGLRLSQPHFGAVIDLIRGQLLMAERADTCVRIPPMLLDGDPGLGKTHFAFELAKVLGTTVKRISFDSALTSATLMGSERRWGNTQYGALFELICLGKHANPIVILDEIDKSESRREWDPLAPLHTLLEPSTAKCVRDISVDFEFDTYMITWIATSNKRAKLSDALRSRFREFHITGPDAEGAIQLAAAVVTKTFGDMQLPDFEPPSKALSVALAHLTAREICQATEQALAHAVAQGRHRVTLQDLPEALGLEDGDAAEGADGAGSGCSTRNPKSWLH
ncbi:MAG: AAA family ATPase [Burkholderiaceae bacterium]|nr:AAA family ATPase [Burkholderiaceae bacterium]